MRKEIAMNNKNLVLDLSEDLKTKSKKLRNEMKKFSKILETEISDTNNNLSGNVSNNNYSKIKDNEELKNLQNYKKENLKIKTLNNVNNNENSENKHFKKINYEIKNNNKKINFFKNSPKEKDTHFQEKFSELRKERNLNKGKTQNFKFEPKQFKNETAETHNFHKNKIIKDLRGTYFLKYFKYIKLKYSKFRFKFD